MVQKGLVIGILFLMVFSLLPAMTIGYHEYSTTEKIDQDDLQFFCYGEESASLGSYYKKCNVETHPNDAIASDFSVISNKGSQDISGSPPMDSPWPMKCHDTYHTGRSPYSTATNNPGFEKWHYQTEGWIEDTPVIDEDGTIYFGEDWNLHALFPNGTEKWTTNIGGLLWGSSPAIDRDGVIYVGSWNAGLYALYPNGTKKWRFGAGDTIASSPAIAEDGTIYFGTMGSGCNIFAVNPDGTEKWRYPTGYYITSDPAIGNDGTIYIGSGDNYLYAMNPSGTLKWRFPTGHYIKSPPSIADDGTIYIGSWDDYVYALYLNGTMKWKCQVGPGTETNPSIGADGTIYVGSDQLYAIYPNGTLKWSFPIPGEGSIHQSSPAISAEGIIYFGTDDSGTLFAINPDGTERWHKRIAGMWVESSPSIGSDGTVYIGSSYDINSGYLYAFGKGPLEADANGPYFGIAEELVAFFGAAYGGNGSYAFSWDFGDDNTSEEQNPTHTYASPGNYTVTLTVTDAEDNISEDTTWAFIVERTELGIDISKDGIIIKNIGDATAYDVKWTLDITGGFLGLINKHLDGRDEELTVGEEITMTLPFLLGLGPLTVSATAEASNADSIAEAKDGFILLFFVILP